MKAAFVPVPSNADDVDHYLTDTGYDKQNAHLYSIIGSMETFRLVIGKPMVTLSWVCGTRIGGYWSRFTILF